MYNFHDEDGEPIVEVGTDVFVEQHRRELNEPGRYRDGRTVYAVGNRDIDEEHFNRTGFTEPIFFPAGSERIPDGLWIANQENFDIDDVFKHVGEDFVMRYTDSQTQVPYKTTFARWREYFKNKAMATHFTCMFHENLYKGHRA